jgi:lysophospholipase L1-like esterase
MKGENKKYLALGDSYTIAEGLSVTDGYPYQLIGILNKKYTYDTPTIIARTGWRTDELLHAIDSANIPYKYDLVTLLIGVNNQYQKKELSIYEAEFAELLLRAIVLADGQKKHVIVLSIPDYGVTPYGASDAVMIYDEINKYNAVNRKVSLATGVHYVDITALSRSALLDDTLTAADGLHPTAAMYSLWAAEIIASGCID